MEQLYDNHIIAMQSAYGQKPWEKGTIPKLLLVFPIVKRGGAV